MIVVLHLVRHRERSDYGGSYSGRGGFYEPLSRGRGGGYGGPSYRGTLQ